MLDPQSTCSVPGCNRPVRTCGLCNAHHLRLLRHGDVGPAKTILHPIGATPEERFWSMVDRSGGPDVCWPWRGGLHSGYGRTTFDGAIQQAHRVAWQLVNGPIPDGLWILHKCDNPPCCNPRDLYAGTPLDNMTDRSARGRAPLGDLWGQDRPRGERVTGHKLTDDDVRAIRARYRPYKVSTPMLAREYGVRQSTIHNIITRKWWKHVE